MVLGLTTMQGLAPDSFQDTPREVAGETTWPCPAPQMGSWSHLGI